MMKKILNYIDGELVEPESRDYLDNYAPATGQVYSQVPNSNESDINSAIAAAERATGFWRKMTISERANILRSVARAIESRLEEFAKAESWDSGKPVTLAKTLDIPRVVQNLDFFADIIQDFKGEFFQTREGVFNFTLHKPLGVVACISPWNLPLYLFTWKIAPALVAGNTVVAKPSELTPMTAFMLSEVCKDIVPRGVLNIVHGLGPSVGSPLVQHEKVKAVSFTGSTATGRSIAQAVAGSFKKVSLEMGGKNATIVFADCDFDKAVNTTVRAAFLNQGQICLCGSRIFVERSIYNKFRDALIEKTKSLKQGDPRSEATDQGALVSAAHMEKVLGYLDKAKAEGAQFLTGGSRASVAGECAQGYFVQPTLIEGLPSSSVVNQEEIFGPVAALIPFDSEEEVLDAANSTRYGLSAAVWTQDLNRGHRVAEALDVGVVWLNTWMLRDLRTPFGGVKESGVGREGGLYGLKFFSEIKNICLDTQRGV